jgi:hypothetical protein
MIKQALIGHDSTETAYMIDDYPYSFTLRCRMRVWIESKKGHGQRVVSQTTNPKKGDTWNKPKAGIYHTIALMYLDELTGHVEFAALSLYDSIEKVEKVVAEHGEAAFADPWRSAALKYMRAVAAKRRAEREVVS